MAPSPCVPCTVPLTCMLRQGFLATTPAVTSARSHRQSARPAAAAGPELIPTSSGPAASQLPERLGTPA